VRRAGPSSVPSERTRAGVPSAVFPAPAALAAARIEATPGGTEWKGRMPHTPASLTLQVQSVCGSRPAASSFAQACASSSAAALPTRSATTDRRLCGGPNVPAIVTGPLEPVAGDRHEPVEASAGPDRQVRPPGLRTPVPRRGCRLGCCTAAHGGGPDGVAPEADQDPGGAAPASLENRCTREGIAAGGLAQVRCAGWCRLLLSRCATAEPRWRQARLLARGLRAISAIVSPGQSENRPVVVFSASRRRTSVTNASSRSPKRCGAAYDIDR
jgi:hypothetical protein